MIDLGSVGAALKGMFRIRPNSPSHKAMLEELDTLEQATAFIRDSEKCPLDDTLRRIAETMR